MPSFFGKEYIQFFRALEKNNNKEWFQKNRKEYENYVRSPFLEYVASIALKMQKAGWNIETDPARCISRINRDIRFSKDKAPYNVYMTAFFSQRGSNDKSLPGFFLRFGARDTTFMAGSYGPTTEQLKSIRTHIASDTESFKKLIKDKNLVHHFGQILGEKNKRLSPEYQGLLESIPDLARKQFYFIREEKPDFIVQPDLMKKTMELWKVARPFNDYLIEAHHGI
ncbi:MAG: DUF2461 domain-containing protein [Leptospiraceae bacterium]